MYDAKPDAPVPLHEREELIRIVAAAIHTDLAARETRISQERARAVADSVLRRIMSAGLTVSEPPPQDPAA